MSVTYLRGDGFRTGENSDRQGGMSATSVLIADAQILFADALAMAFGAWSELTVFQERPATGVETVKVTANRRPDVALVDYWLAEMDGPAAAREILGLLPETRIIHLSWFHGPDHVRASLASGAVGFLPKSLLVPQVVEAIHRAVAGERPVFGDRLGRMIAAIEHQAEQVDRDAERFATLTPRELEVLRELGYGRTLQQIARNLGISYGTARTHQRRLLSKTQAASTLEVVARAKNQGLVP